MTKREILLTILLTIIIAVAMIVSYQYFHVDNEQIDETTDKTNRMESACLVTYPDTVNPVITKQVIDYLESRQMGIYEYKIGKSKYLYEGHTEDGYALIVVDIDEEKFHSILLDDWVANTEDGDEYDSMKIKVNRWRGTYYMMNDTQFIKTQHYYEIICSPDDYTCYDDFPPEAEISHWTYTSKYAIRNYRFILLKTDTTFISK